MRSLWKIFFSRLLGIAIIIMLLPLVIQVVRIIWFMSRTSYSLAPFTQNNQNAKIKILFVGDSTAVGTGAANNQQSVAGWLGKYYPTAHIDNWGRNGLRLADLATWFDPAMAKIHYEVVILQIGGNDILRFTNLKNVERDLMTVLERAKIVGKHVVILHSGNVGLSPIFIWPFDWIFTERTRSVREIYAQKTKETGAIYIDLFTERQHDPFFSNNELNLYSSDYLHPSGLGYVSWYARMRLILDVEHVPFD